MLSRQLSLYIFCYILDFVTWVLNCWDYWVEKAMLNLLEDSWLAIASLANLPQVILVTASDVSMEEKVLVLQVFLQELSLVEKVLLVQEKLLVV